MAEVQVLGSPVCGSRAGVLRLPREHGFWVMLGAIISSATLRSDAPLLTLAVAIVVFVVAVLAAMFARRFVRRSGVAQVALAAGLGGCSVPFDLAIGSEPSTTVMTSLTFSVVFAASALSVRAAFARSSPRHAGRAIGLDLAAILLPAAVAALASGLGASWAAGAAWLSAAVLLGIALVRPTVKRLKHLGIGLAVLHAACVVILGRGGL